MPQNISYTSKSRSSGVNKGFPSRTRSSAVDTLKMGPGSRSPHNTGKPPTKGVATRGGQHG